MFHSSLTIGIVTAVLHSCTRSEGILLLCVEGSVTCCPSAPLLLSLCSHLFSRASAAADPMNVTHRGNPQGSAGCTWHWAINHSVESLLQCWGRERPLLLSRAEKKAERLVVCQHGNRTAWPRATRERRAQALRRRFYEQILWFFLTVKNFALLHCC